MPAQVNSKPGSQISLVVGKPQLSQAIQRKPILDLRKPAQIGPKASPEHSQPQRPFSQRTVSGNSKPVLTIGAQSKSITMVPEDQPSTGDVCSICRNPFDWAAVAQAQCSHFVCLECINSYLAKKLKIEGQVTCFVKACKGNWTQSTISMFYNFTDEDNMSETNSQSSFCEGVVCCVKCKTKGIVEPGDEADSPNQDSAGRQLMPLHRRMYAEDRFKCSCGCEQCKICGVTPFHVGYTCSEYGSLVQCRYCEEGLEHDIDYKKSPLSDLCMVNEECMNRSQVSCSHILKCNHRCFGFKGDKDGAHPACLVSTCKDYKERRSNVCTFCNDPLSKGPIVELGCQDAFHYLCLEKSLKKGWFTKRITFGFLDCANCKSALKIPTICALRDIAHEHKKLQKEVTDLCVKKLTIDKRTTDKQLADPNSRFFKKPELYALTIYACYQCKKCRKPFIGGQVNCEVEANIDPDNSANAEYICLPCSGGKNCSIHGADAIIHKCKFCCSFATWFCFGTTHFCTPCHDKQSRTPSYALKGPWPACDPAACPLKGDHPKVPSEHLVGCALCKNV